jgi:anti-sigma B factor antagonist
VQMDMQRQGERVTVVSPRGRLDMASAPAFRDQMRDLVSTGSSCLVVDLANVTFVDSSGLGAVIGGLRLARQAGGDLRIACPTDQVRMVLDITSLDRVLRPYPSLEEATDGL